MALRHQQWIGFAQHRPDESSWYDGDPGAARRVRALYRAFGPEGPGAFIEMGAIITGVVLVLLVGKRRPAFYLTLAGATLLAAAFFLVWIPFVSPVNAETANG
jgi:hypothetical protein